MAGVICLFIVVRLIITCKYGKITWILNILFNNCTITVINIIYLSIYLSRSSFNIKLNIVKVN